MTDLEKFKLVRNGEVVIRDLILPDKFKWTRICHYAIKVSDYEVIDFISKADAKTGHQISRRSVYSFLKRPFRGTAFVDINRNPERTKKWAEYFHYLAVSGQLECKYDLLSLNCIHFCKCCIEGKMPIAKSAPNLVIDLICKHIIGD